MISGQRISRPCSTIPDIKAIICARGGYGTVRIIRQLNFDRFLQHPKWIAGCSDITVLHGFLQNLGVESLHSEMPRFVPPAEPDLVSMDSLRAALFGETRQYIIQPHADNRPGKSRGILIGGNLSVLYSLAGSDLEPDIGRPYLIYRRYRRISVSYRPDDDEPVRPGQAERSERSDCGNHE